MVGLSLLHQVLRVGIDGIRVWHPEGYSVGVFANVGIGGRPGRNAIIASTILGGVVGLAVLAMLGAWS